MVRVAWSRVWIIGLPRTWTSWHSNAQSYWFEPRQGTFLFFLVCFFFWKSQRPFWGSNSEPLGWSFEVLLKSWGFEPRTWHFLFLRKFKIGKMSFLGIEPATNRLILLFYFYSKVTGSNPTTGNLTFFFQKSIKMFIGESNLRLLWYTFHNSLLKKTRVQIPIFFIIVCLTFRIGILEW